MVGLPRWFRLANPWISFPSSIVAVWLCIQEFPDPPAVQEAQARKWARARQEREEDFLRATEEKIEKFKRENPEAFNRILDEVRQDRD